MDLQKLTLAVCNIAKRAGSYIADEREKFSFNVVERKHAHDYVSYVDKGSEQLIVAALRELLPEAGFITEEGSAGHDSQQLLWVIDPLDGTTNFIHHYAPYAVSIALIQGHEILLGVVYEICAAECYYAWKDGGAYMNGERIHVSHHAIDDALLCLQLPYNSEAYKPVAKHFIDTFYGRCASIRMTQQSHSVMWPQDVSTAMPNSISDNGTSWQALFLYKRLVVQSLLTQATPTSPMVTVSSPPTALYSKTFCLLHLMQTTLTKLNPFNAPN